MTNPSQFVHTKIIPMLVPSESVQLAKQLAQQHPQLEYAERTYHNLLAVLAVNHYLKILGIATDLSQCDCWNPFLRLTTNVADLEVVNYGRFECCPISPDVMASPSAFCIVPSDVQDERIGYIVVSVDGELETTEPTVQLIGFTDAIDGEKLPLAQLKSLFELPKYLERIKATCLSNWFKDLVEDRWHALETLLEPQVCRSLQIQTRSSDSQRQRLQAKTLTLPSNSNDDVENNGVVLIAEVSNNPDNRLDVELRICPMTEQSFLPPGLEMTIVDILGEPVMQAQARAENRMMELGFHAELGDRFQLLVRLNDESLVESFIV
ncbi:MAG: DUF1822 family protein [Cyanobacteria bacterium P01_A01_bin.37]